jgi:hypothetical protein
MRVYLACLAVAVVSVAFAACGGSTTNGNSSNNQDAATDDGGMSGPETGSNDGATDGATDADAGPPLDHGDASDVYPAFMPTFGQIADQGGYVMANPIIVPITWDSDPAQAMFDTFADTIGASTYWQATTSEYGVGPAVSGTANHVHISTAAPTTITDSELQSMVTTNAGTTWPAETQDTIFIFFIAPTTSLEMGNSTACAEGTGGYHGQLSSSGNPYAVVASCDFKITPSAATQSMASATHEIIESATDPQPNTNTAYYHFTDPGFAFEYFQQIQDTEIGDACEFFPDSFFEYQDTATPFTSWVQRTWSNKSPLAGHAPCVPELPGEVYFNVTPFGQQMVTVTVKSFNGTQTQQTLGYKIPAGTSSMFQVGFYSEADTGGPWSLSAVVGNPLDPLLGGSTLDTKNTSSVTASVDKTSGVNGEKAWVTVNVKTSGATFQGELITLISSGSSTHYMPVWIAGP